MKITFKEEQLKLKKMRKAENESMYIRGPFFTNKVLIGFDDDANF
jgi:hypothetical protein